MCTTRRRSKSEREIMEFGIYTILLTARLPGGNYLIQTTHPKVIYVFDNSKRVQMSWATFTMTWTVHYGLSSMPKVCWITKTPLKHFVWCYRANFIFYLKFVYFCVIIKLLKVKFLNYHVKFYNIFYPDPFSLLKNEINVRAGNFYISYVFFQILQPYYNWG